MTATLTVVGQPQGRDGIGGEDYDQRLARWMAAEVGAGVVRQPGRLR